MPQPSTCSCRLPGLKPSKLSAGLQGNNSYSYMPLNTCVSYMPQPSTCSCPPSNPPNASNPPAGLQGNNSYSYMPLPSVFQEVQDCHLPALKPPKRFQRFRRPPRQQLLQLYMPLPSVFQGVQDCRLPGVKPPKRFQPSRRPPRQQLLQLHAPAICFSGGSRLPFACPQTPQTLPTFPQASKATTLTAIHASAICFSGGSRLPFARRQTPQTLPNASAGLQGNNSYSYMPLPSVFQEVQDCRLPALKPPKRFQPSRRPPRQQLLQLHAAAICFLGCSRLPFARPHQTPETFPTLPQASKATTLTAKCPCHLFFRGFKTAVCPPSNPLKPPKRFRRPPRQQLLQLHAPEHLCQLHAPAIYMLLPFARPQTLQTLRRPPRQQLLQLHAPEHLCQLHAPAIYMLLPALKPPKRFQPSRRPPREQLLQLHAPAICFSGGSRLPFARPQTP